MKTIDWPPQRPSRRRGRLFLLILLFALLLSAGTALSLYVEALWFDALGLGSVFWTTLNLRAVVFGIFTVLSFLVLYVSFVLLKPQVGDIRDGTILVNGQPVKLPLEPIVRLGGIAISLVIAFGSGLGMSTDWETYALYWYGGTGAGSAAAQAAANAVDPIFGRSIGFYFFTLPAWQLIAGWLTTLVVLVFIGAVVFAVIGGGARLLEGRRRAALPTGKGLRGISAAFALVLLMIAAQTWLGRFERIYADHTIFAGVTYTDDHVMVGGLSFVALALVLGAAIAFVNAVRQPRILWLVIAVAPAVLVYAVVGIISSYMSGFIVKPNELVRESPYITHNIEMTRRAYGLNRIELMPFPAETGLDALEAENNQDTLQNIRLWDWRALQDTLRQLQEIRTYYDFPDIDIDRYEVDGRVRQMMLAVRELNIERLPESSRNWINEKLIYTHGYGITMTPVNGFTPEGLPDLILRDMPVQTTVPALSVSRPEIYFGEATNTDVYVRTRQKEFNYPQGETNSLTSYEGNGGIVLGGFFRRLLIAAERGDLTKLPFSDDVNAESRLLMRRNIRERVTALAPFLVFDPDPYIVIGEGGRLLWMIDGFTTAATYPYSRHYRLDRTTLNYMRNSVKAVVDAYDGSVTFYVFDDEDPIVAAYRGIFPALFKDVSEMPADLRKHVRYPELLLQMQAMVYGVYHIVDPAVFYNREDLWTVASEVGMQPQQRGGQAQPMEPNFILMKLPGEKTLEFVEMLPFTPANRNNLIGWIAGRSDGPNYGKALVYNFPKTRLVDGPLQIEARIDQDPRLSGQLSLWNQQGSSVRRGSLIVIPIARALLYAEPIYLQAAHSPMPELRLVVLALQDRMAYGPTFESALAAMLGKGSSTITFEPGAPSAAPPSSAARPGTPPPAAPPPASDTNALITGAARDLADYQRLTSEGKLGEAGQRLEALKQKLEQLQKR